MTAGPVGPIHGARSFFQQLPRQMPYDTPPPTFPAGDEPAAIPYPFAAAVGGRFQIAAAGPSGPGLIGVGRCMVASIEAAGLLPIGYLDPAA